MRAIMDANFEPASAGGTECESLGRESQVVIGETRSPQHAIGRWAADRVRRRIIKKHPNSLDLRPRNKNVIAPRFKKTAHSRCFEGEHQLNYKADFARTNLIE